VYHPEVRAFEVWDADAFALFKERGLFDSEMARSFRTDVLEKGGTEDALRLYVRFRGGEPDVTPMLKRRGFVRP
jgi:peptidyl-dipeptidase Dcp